MSYLLGIQVQCCLLAIFLPHRTQKRTFLSEMGFIKEFCQLTRKQNHHHHHRLAGAGGRSRTFQEAHGSVTWTPVTERTSKTLTTRGKAWEWEAPRSPGRSTRPS